MYFKNLPCSFSPCAERYVLSEVFFYSLHLLLWNFYFCRVPAIQTHQGNCAEEQMLFWWRLSGNRPKDFTFFLDIIVLLKKWIVKGPPPASPAKCLLLPAWRLLCSKETIGWEALHTEVLQIGNAASQHLKLVLSCTIITQAGYWNIVIQ